MIYCAKDTGIWHSRVEALGKEAMISRDGEMQVEAAAVLAFPVVPQKIPDWSRS